MLSNHWQTVRRLAVAIATAGMLAGVSAPVHADVSARIFDAPKPQAQWSYGPQTIKVAPGNWVNWSNTGGDTHSVTAVDGSFDSGELQPSEGFSWYFDTPGTYQYFCTLHTWMQARVVVTGG